MAKFFVEIQFWEHWPKVLVMGRNRNDGTVERRRYVPERIGRTCKLRMHTVYEEGEFDYIECLNCGWEGYVDDGESEKYIPNFCPNCGAKVVDE